MSQIALKHGVSLAPYHPIEESPTTWLRRGHSQDFNADDPAVERLRAVAAGLSLRLGYKTEYQRHR